MAIRPSKLEKLTILVFKDPARNQRIGSFKVMFNPESFSLTHENRFGGEPTIDTSAQKKPYSFTPGKKVSLDLVFDGTGVAEGSEAAGSVSRQIDDFLKSTAQMNGSTHEPNYLRIQWGDGPLQNFDCRLETVTITYSLFDKSGAPLRARLAASFQEDLDDPKRTRIEGKSSPDLTHTRVVKAGDTLPLLCKEIYGSASHYLRVARANDLDGFRELAPGARIVFPPLARQAAR